MHSNEKILEQLAILKDIGGSIAVDNFGTGYLSLPLIKNTFRQIEKNKLFVYK